LRIGSSKKLPWLGGSITYVYGGREPGSANTGFKLQLGVQYYFKLPPDGICDLSHQEALGLLCLDFVFLQVTFLLCLSCLIYQEKENTVRSIKYFTFQACYTFWAFCIALFWLALWDGGGLEASSLYQWCGIN
jgi:hypothetical protein